MKDIKPLKLSDKLEFGKYKGQSIKEIIKCDVQYISWAINEKIIKLRFIANIVYEREYSKWLDKTRFARALLYIRNHSDLAAREFHEDCGDR